MAEIILKEESYKIIGACMEVHKELGMGFREIVYKDALEMEFKENNIKLAEKSNMISFTKAKSCRESILQILLYLTL